MGAHKGTPNPKPLKEAQTLNPKGILNPKNSKALKEPQTHHLGRQLA